MVLPLTPRTKKCTRVADRGFPEVKSTPRQGGDFWPLSAQHKKARDLRKSYIAIGGVDLVKGRIRPEPGPVMVAVAQDINRHLWDCDWLENAPFDLVNFILRFGESKPETEIKRINRRHTELPVARELSMEECVQRAVAGALYDYFHDETMKALTDVSKRYDLPLDWLDAIKTERGG